MGIIIKNGHLVDVEADRDGYFDIYVNDDGKELEESLTAWSKKALR